MRDSYWILDEQMRFLNCTRGHKDPTRSILDIGVERAARAAGFDAAAFSARGGYYEWSKDMDRSPRLEVDW